MIQTRDSMVPLRMIVLYVHHVYAMVWFRDLWNELLYCTITLRVEYLVGGGRSMCVLDLGYIFMGTDAWKWFEGLIYSNAEIRVIWIRNKTLVLTFKFRATCLSTSRGNIPSRYFPLLNPCFELLDVCVLYVTSKVDLSSGI